MVKENDKEPIPQGEYELSFVLLFFHCERCHQAQFINYQIGGDREIRKVKPARGDLAFFDFNFLSPGKKVKWEEQKLNRNQISYFWLIRSVGSEIIAESK